MPTADLYTDQQKMNLGSTRVELFKLDATNNGAASPYYFTTGTMGVSAVQFGGVTYTAIPCKLEGFQIQGRDKQNRPTIIISNITNQLYAEYLAYNKFMGSEVTRKITYYKYLDGQPEENNGNIYSTDIWVVGISSDNKYQLVLELKNPLDCETLLLGTPATHTCTHVYGIGGSSTTCPYDGANGYFNRLGQSVGSGDDDCGHRYTDCCLRYGIDERKPFRGFHILGMMGYPYRR